MIDIHTMSVLIVDDMRSMRLSIRNMFKQLGFGSTIDHAENGKMGLKMLNEGRYDLAMIDWNMPIMNGVQLLENIRSSKTLRDMPVIMITAEADRATVANVAETEIDAYLLKPLTPKSLEEKLKIVIHNANHPDRATQLLYKARDCEEAGDIKGAIQAMRLALKEKPKASRIMRNLGLLYEWDDNDDMAEKCLVKAAAMNREDDASRLHLVEFFLNKNDLRGALNAYEKGEIRGEALIQKGMLLGERLMTEGLTSEATTLFNRFQEKIKIALPIQERIVNVCLKNREFTYPKKLLEEMVKSQPERYDLMLKLAKLYDATQETDKAFTCYETITANVMVGEELNWEQLINAKLWMAQYYIKQKKPFIADDYINQVLKIDKDNETALKLRRLNA